MSTLKSIIFETLPDPEEYYETTEALRDLDRQYQHFTRTVWKASKQLLKFDEINRLVAYEVEEKEPKVTTSRPPEAPDLRPPPNPPPPRPTPRKPLPLPPRMTIPSPGTSPLSSS